MEKAVEQLDMVTASKGVKIVLVEKGGISPQHSTDLEPFYQNNSAPVLKGNRFY